MKRFNYLVMIRLGVMVGAVLLLASCLGVAVETRFNADGSGTMTMQMRISKSVIEMGQESEGDTGFDIPTSKEDIEAQYEGVPGVELVEVIEEETAEDLIITATVEFESFEALIEAEEQDSPVETATLTTTGGETTFSMVVGGAADAMGGEASPFGEEDMDEAMIAMMAAFLEGYSMDYVVTAPKQVSSHSHGELSGDGRTVTLSMPMADYFFLTEPITFEVVW